MKNLITLLSLIICPTLYCQDATVVNQNEKTVVGSFNYGPNLMSEVYTLSEFEDTYFFTFKNQKYTQITDYKTISMSSQAFNTVKESLVTLINSTLGEEVVIEIGEVRLTMERGAMKSVSFFVFENGVGSHVYLNKKAIIKTFGVSL